MKGKLAFTLCAMLLVSNNLMAGKYSDEDVEKLLKRVDQLEKIVKQFKGDYEEQMDELNARVDDNEFQASLNRIKWGGEFETTVGNYWGKQGSIQGMLPGSKFHNNNKWDLKLRLNMQTKINDKTKFTGRLSMYKGWASNQAWGGMSGYPGTFDSSDGRMTGGSGIFVERAYIDYKITNNLIATIGRQPSNDGPGANLKNNTPRKSTYPAILFNGNADGIILSYKLPKNIPHGAVRIAYGKGFQWNSDRYGYTANQGTLKDLNVYGAFLEGSLPLKKMGNNLLVFSAVLGKDFVGDPNNGNTLSNTNLGDFKHYGLYFENNKAFGTNFNYFISTAMSDPKSNGKSYTSPGYPPMKLLDKNGYAYHVGIRYDFNSKFKAGYEFNHGSKYWFSYTTGSYDPLNKIATRGNANDVYLIYQIDMNQYLRAGYTDIDYKYTGSGWHMAPNGTPLSTDDYTKLFYLNYNIKF